MRNIHNEIFRQHNDFAQMYLNQDQADCHLREVVQQRLRLKDAVLPSIRSHDVRWQLQVRLPAPELRRTRAASVEDNSLGEGWYQAGASCRCSTTARSTRWLERRYLMSAQSSDDCPFHRPSQTSGYWYPFAWILLGKRNLLTASFMFLHLTHSISIWWQEKWPKRTNRPNFSVVMIFV